MAILLELIERWNTICIGIPGAFLLEIDEPMQTLLKKMKGTQNGQNHLGQEQSGRTHGSRFQKLLQTIVSKQFDPDIRINV